MHVSDFDFELPAELIAQAPPAVRGTSRLMVLDRATGVTTVTSIDTLAAHLRAGDLVVVNDTRVLPARLLGRRVPSGGAVECLLLESVAAEDAQTQVWLALMHPGQKLRPGAHVHFERDGVAIDGDIVGYHHFGRRTIRLRTETSPTLDAAIDAIGHVPLPPYIKRPDEAADRERYQTVFAATRGSIAAPTAGLHFTRELVESLAARGIDVARLTLHVGYGTFKPVRSDVVEEHDVDPERYHIGADAAARINQQLDAGGRVIAVGTTTTRALESAALAGGGRLAPGPGVAGIFIHPGFRFQVLDGLLTNFHLPRSSLLMLVAAFAGRERVLAAYRRAVDEGFRFYSYGDAMLVV